MRNKKAENGLGYDGLRKPLLEQRESTLAERIQGYGNMNDFKMKAVSCELVGRKCGL